MKKLNLQTLAMNTRSVEFSNACGLTGLTITLSYQSRSSFEKMRENSTIQKIDESGIPYKDLDKTVYIKNYATAVVKGWKGFTYGHLASLVLIDETQVTDMSEEIEFDAEYAVFLMENSEKFDAWVTTMLRSLDNFRK